ncbi:MAG: glycoside hydrolase family 104 protein [Merismopedia sp. SIO2A8]|nr:glycoside hydrolase family 104 protein [Symploca sp. SIO2B6]NET47325.1 glycoside hydrolase family 104 protein [Merismopedia sp. SIO2A8]
MNKIIKPLDIKKQIYYELTPERLAILDLIAYTEGTDKTIGSTKAGFDTIYGYKKFTPGKDHPRKKVTSGGFTSTAAGRYQIIDNTWDWLQQKLKQTGFVSFPSFAPIYQDQAALFLIDAKRDSMKEVDSENLNGFLEKCSWEWASLPPARYPPQKTLPKEKCWQVYRQLLNLWKS